MKYLFEFIKRKGKVFPPYVYVLLLMIPTVILFWLVVLSIAIELICTGQTVAQLSDVAIVLGLVVSWMSVYQITNREG